MESGLEIQRKSVIPLLFGHFEKRRIELFRANGADDIDKDVDLAETLHCDAGHFAASFASMPLALDNLTLGCAAQSLDCSVEAGARYIRQYQACTFVRISVRWPAPWDHRHP
jgi:hypothetical protein